jgi:peptidoglycan hydrolase CwlO-like protein|tara:strand:+ start:215 stop:574 length:360 start_codon:yes stop_codon:yes gene_type:complete
MEWFKSKGGQIIALATIVSTLAGFGYAGAGYVNRLENLEKKIGGIGETEDAQQQIEQRFTGIETSVEYLEKQIDNIEIPDNSESISSLKAQLSGLSISVKELEKDVDKLEDSNSNPLAN